MKSKYKPYSSYRDSGVRWLGDIPESWKVIKTAYLFSSAMGQTILKEDLIDDGRYPVYSATAEDKFFGYVNYATVKLKKNDIVIPARGNSIGFVKLVKDNATTTQTTIYCKPLTQRTNPKYVYYYMLGLKPHLFYFVQTAIPQITVSEVLSNPLLLPPFQDQQTIANYLDSATAKIDTLIEKQTRLIALLKEKRQAVISTAVTRGLDNTVAMKDSGVEWLGEIPEHWEVKKLKNSARIQGGKDQKAVLDDNGKYPVYGSGGIFGYANKYLHNGESVLLGRKGTVDKPLYVHDKFWTVDTMYYTVIEKTTVAKWLYYSATTINFDYYQYGSAVPSMTQEDLHNIHFATPDKNEQQVIVDYLDTKTTQIDSLVSKATKAIELLKEKRTALISSAVTGKIDVREIV